MEAAPPLCGQPGHRWATLHSSPGREARWWCPPTCKWLIGDESALPAIGRRLEELPDDVAVTVVVECEQNEDLPLLQLGSQRRLLRVLRPAGGTGEEMAAPLLETLRSLPAPEGRGHAFAAAESHTVKAVRELLIAHHGLSKGQIRASAYWRRGDSGHHENLDG